MSGPLSVVTACIGLFVPSIPGRVLFFVLAAVAFVIASFDVWRREHIKTLHPPLSPVVIERRKIIKAKYNELSSEGQAVLRQITVEGSIQAPMIHANTPHYWYDMKDAGFIENNHEGRMVLARGISDDVVALIEEEIRSTQAIPATPKRDP
jgi:hypothetical protein